MSFDVITFGSATLDIFAETAKERVVELCTEDGCHNFLAYPSGEKVLVDELHTDVGGGATNTAATFAKLGVKTACCACIGDDDAGDSVIHMLEKLGISFVGSIVDVRTNLSYVIDSKKLHDRTIFVYKGSSNELAIEDLDLTELDSTWFYFSSLVGKSYKTMLELMRYARKQGIAIAFNPSQYQTQLGFDALREPLTLANFVVMNTEEAAQLVGKGTRDEQCRRLRENGCEIVLITDGPRGATLLYAETLYILGESLAPDAVETTGAGDCFAASFVSGLIIGKHPRDALVLAALNAENLVMHVGPKNGLLTKKEALTRLEADTREVIAELSEEPNNQQQTQNN